MAVSLLIANSDATVLGIISLIGGILTLLWMAGVYDNLSRCAKNTYAIIEAQQAIWKELRRAATEAHELQTEISETLLKILAELQSGKSDGTQKQALPTPQRKPQPRRTRQRIRPLWRLWALKGNPNPRACDNDH